MAGGKSRLAPRRGAPLRWNGRPQQWILKRALTVLKWSLRECQVVLQERLPTYTRRATLITCACSAAITKESPAIAHARRAGSRGRRASTRVRGPGGAGEGRKHGLPAVKAAVDPRAPLGGRSPRNLTLSHFPPTAPASRQAALPLRPRPPRFSPPPIFLGWERAIRSAPVRASVPEYRLPLAPRSGRGRAAPLAPGGDERLHATHYERRRGRMRPSKRSCP